MQLIARVENRWVISTYLLSFSNILHVPAMNSIMPAHSELHMHTMDFVCLRVVDSTRVSVCVMWTHYVPQFAYCGLNMCVNLCAVDSVHR